MEPCELVSGTNQRQLHPTYVAPHKMSSNYFALHNQLLTYFKPLARDRDVTEPRAAPGASAEILGWLNRRVTAFSAF
jgi:hypothetical protein